LIGVDFDFVDDEHVRRSVGFVLGEDDAFEEIGIEIMDGGGCEFGERDFDLRPAICGEIADEFAELQGSRELRVCIDDANFWESAIGDCVGRIAPKEKISADEADFAIAETHYVDARVPATVTGGGPFEAKCVWRRVEDFGFDWEFVVDESERAWGGGVAGAVEVGVALETVVENDVVIVERVGNRSAGRRCEKECQREGECFEGPEFVAAVS